VADWLWAFKAAVSVAIWALGTVPEVAVKVTLLWPDGTVTLEGAESNALSLLSDTTVALGAAAFSVTVQVLDELLPSAEGAQESDVSCAGGAEAFAVSVKVWETPFREAVSSAV
jgi:hypothetical protein